MASFVTVFKESGQRANYLWKKSQNVIILPPNRRTAPINIADGTEDSLSSAGLRVHD
jgi:hypothetical protein